VRNATDVLEGSTGTKKAVSLPTPLPPPRAVMFSESCRDNTDEDRRSSSRNNRPTPPMTVGRKSKRIQRLMSQVQLPRLITRDFPYHQSSSRVEITNVQRHILYRLIYRDWFHLMLRQPAWVTFPSLILIWYMSIWVWAFAYVLVDRNNGLKDCGISEADHPIEIREAFAFSLETTTTVGYGLPGSTNAFFEDHCTLVQGLICAQMIWSMLANAFLTGFMFAVLSKSENRSVQIVFSNKLIINVIDGKVCANVRCYDLDSAFPLVECHCRMYLVDHKMKFHPLRLIEPNDELGGVLYPSAPTSIIHHIDHHSALSPVAMPLTEGDHGLVLRSIDSATASREEIVCPVCGEAYGTYARLMKHIRYAQLSEERDGYPLEGSHLGFQMPDTSPITLEEVQRHVERKLSEIVVVVEAIDPQLSGTFQSLQSYKYDDIEFGAEFEQCLFHKQNKFFVDLTKFHDIVYKDDMYDRSDLSGWNKKMAMKGTSSRSDSNSSIFGSGVLNFLSSGKKKIKKEH